MVNHVRSLLLEHLLIPAGAKLKIWADSLNTTEDHLPRSLDNLRNLSNFTKIYVSETPPCIRFSGPNGQLCLTAFYPDDGWSARGSLARFGTSKVKQLDIHHPTHSHPYETLLPVK